MNPELLRNIWIELTPPRLLIMGGGLALALLAAALTGGLAYGPTTLARWLYLVIVILFGTRNAALSVAGEIRNRTWDSQRLSAFAADEMVFGKLFGSTIYFWCGGIVCLGVLAAGISVHAGFAAAVTAVIYYALLGVAAQAAALLASLIALRRRLASAPLSTLLYQLVGIAAAFAIAGFWPDPSSGFMPGPNTASVTLWWGVNIPSPAFILASLAVFTGLIVVGCYREMRLELQLKNGPFVWLGFLAFIAIYVAGFDRLEAVFPLSPSGWLAPRLALAFLVLALSAYAMVLLEPKDLVRFRWLLARVSSGRFREAFLAADAWILSVLAAFAVAIILGIALWWQGSADENAGARLASALGFLVRDISTFVLMRSRKIAIGSDAVAVAALAALYALLPAIITGLGLKGLLFVFYPVSANPLFLGPVVAWTEGLTLASLVLAHINRMEMRPMHLH